VFNLLSMKTSPHSIALLLAALLTCGLTGRGAEPMKMTVKELPAATAAKTKFFNPQYLVYTPAKAASGKKLPLLIFLHGSGGRGADISKLKADGPVKYLNEREDRQSFLLVIPQSMPQKDGTKGQWEPQDLELLLAHLRITESFDEKRIYLTGYSMGGYGTWAWAAANPGNFAAIAPLAGGLGEGPKGVTSDLEDWLDNLKVLPIWIFHGAKDTVVPTERSERMLAGLKKRGADVKLKIYPDDGHGIVKAYWEPELYAWLLSHQRKH
jgi:predicted peptidase